MVHKRSSAAGNSPAAIGSERLHVANINRQIAEELGIREQQVEATVALLDGGATVPFVARYRKEITGALDDAQLRTLEERLNYLRELEERRKAILESVREQGKLDAALEAAIMAADSKGRLEDIYLPFKPKRRTKAEIAREAGLEPLADLLLSQPGNEPVAVAAPFVDADKQVADAAAALDGARAILVERFAEDADLIGALREQMWSNGVMTSTVRRGKKTEGEKFKDYFEFSEPLTKLPSHRILAMFRGEKEEILDLQMLPEPPSATPAAASSYELKIMQRFAISDQGRPGDKWMGETVRWAWRTKIQVHLNVDLRMRLWTAAEQEAIRVFASNLRDLLLAAPAGARVTMGLDPGYRSGVKVAVVDATGKVVATHTIYPHEPARRWDEALATLGKLAKEHRVDLIAIGNGTASRETDKLATELVKLLPDLKMSKIVVSEAGASVYSASAFASEELPDLDVTLRGAASIARRLQDPLAELVKIDPKAIGVGQYQHDLSEGKLARSLDAVVEDCVNAVGVDANTASAPLLARVSGIGSGLAQSIVQHRDANGPFKSRKALKQVPRLGPKAFEQCAGFLRITDGEDPLDASGVHPESYPVVRRILGRHQKRHQGADRQCGDPAPGPAAELRRRHLWPADRDRHPARAGKARPRSAPRLQGGGVQGGRRDAEGPQARHDPRRHGDQCRGVRRLRRYRRAPGRAGAHLGDVEDLHQGSARGGEIGRHRQGQGAGGRGRPQAHRADAASRRRDREQERSSGAGQAARYSARRDDLAGAAQAAAGIRRGAGRSLAPRRREGREAQGLKRPIGWRTDCKCRAIPADHNDCGPRGPAWVLLRPSEASEKRARSRCG